VTYSECWDPLKGLLLEMNEARNFCLVDRLSTASTLPTKDNKSPKMEQWTESHDHFLIFSGTRFFNAILSNTATPYY